MKKLGLVGGMGVESTIPYYHDIVYGVQNRVGEKFFPNITIPLHLRITSGTRRLNFLRFPSISSGNTFGISFPLF